MAEPITATFAVIAWSEPFKSGKGDTLTIRRRESDVYRVTFPSQAALCAFPSAMREAIAHNGGELILCQEIEARYD